MFGKKIHLILIFEIVCLIYTVGQENKLNFEHVTVENGLSNNTVNAIIQDSDGFMWFGTWDGLCRFDGYNFKTFRPEKGNPNSISSNVIRSLIADNDGVLWIGTENGLNKYNPLTESFVSYIHNSNDTNSLSHNLIYNIFEDSSGKIWIGTRGGGLDIFDKETKKFTHPFKILSDKILRLKNVFSICEDNSRNVWFAADEGVYVYNKHTKILKKEEITYQHSGAVSLNIDNQTNTLWIGMWSGGLIKYNILTKETQHFVNIKNNPNSLSNNIIMTISKIYQSKSHSKNEIWIGTREGGLNIYDEKEEKFYTYTSLPNNNVSISDNIILSLYQDKSGIVWIGTKMGGVNKINFNNKKFYSLKPSDFNNLFDNKIMSVYKDNYNNIFMGTGNSGVLRFNAKNNLMKQYYYKPGSYNFKSSPVNVIQGVNQDNHLKIICGSDEQGYQSFNTNNEFSSDLVLKSSYNSGSLYSVFVDSNKIWLGSYGGLDNSGFGFYSFESKRFTKVSLPKTWDKNMYLRVFAITKSHLENIIWIGTRGHGLAKYNTQLDSFIFYNSNPENNNSISNDDVFCIYEKNNIVWIGTGGGGLNKFEINTGKYYQFSKKDGLASDVIYGILPDNLGNLWLSTTFGISKFNTETKKINNYNKKDGLLDNVFNYGSYFKSEQGEMFFGGLNGLTHFFPDSIENNSIVPNVRITELKIQNATVKVGRKINGRVVLKKSITKISKIDLKYSDRSFSLGFSAMDYSIPSKNKYAYKLEGFDENWQYVNATMRYANYTNLNPGKYIFKIKASNNDNLWSADITELIIQINPPFWNTIWFKVIIILLITSLIVLYFKLKTNRLKAYQNQLEEEVRKRTAEVIMQNEEIQVQSDNLIDINEELRERHVEIEKQAEELMKLNTTKDKLFSIIAHDLKNPFHGITSFSKLLMNKTKKISKEKQLEFTELIYKSSVQASGLLESLLQWSQTQTGNIDLNLVCFDLKEVVNMTIGMFELLIRKKNISINNLIDDKIFVFADQNMITTVIRNLLNNAIKYTPEVGKISISIEQDSLFVYVIIQDSGIGMSEDFQKNIFSIDKKHSTNGTAGEMGTGLGLVICKEFVEKNGGIITVKSKQSEGSAFKFSIPVSDKNIIEEKSIENIANTNAEDVLTKIDEENQVNSNKIKPLILVADDHSHIRLGIKEYFKDTFRIIEAVDGREAYSIAIKTLPDLIISDVVMPNIEGVELCDKLKSDIRTSHIPIILLTGQSANEQKIRGFEIGADDYITKPFDVSVLKVRVINLIKSRRKLSEIFSSNKESTQNTIPENSLDNEFLSNIIDVINKNLSNVDFSLNGLLKEIGMSNSQLYRKLMALTGQSANEFIRNHRLKCSAKMIKDKQYSVSEIAYSVGFNSPSYFTKCFKDYYGILPTEYL